MDLASERKVMSHQMVQPGSKQQLHGVADKLVSHGGNSKFVFLRREFFSDSLGVTVITSNFENESEPRLASINKVRHLSVYEQSATRKVFF